MKLCIASGNAHKVIEIKDILGDIFSEYVTAKQLGVDMDAAKETGSTFAENALIKAQYLFNKTGCASIADDSGLCVDYLGGAPGVLSARYSGKHGDDEANNQLLLKNLTGVNERSARFECAVVLVLSGDSCFTGSGSVPGFILQKSSGSGGFGYDSLFFSTELNKSFGDSTPEEKNSVSHRFRALTDLLCKIEPLSFTK